MKYTLLVLIIISVLSCNSEKKEKKELITQIQSNEYFAFTKEKAIQIVKTGFNAGDGYGQVWIRDYNTFIELSAQVYDSRILKENLLPFFKLQGDDGNIIDGFAIIKNPDENTPDLFNSKLETTYSAHKNTVETDQETSLIQSVYKYIQLTGDRFILEEKVGDKTVAERMIWAMEFLMNKRFNEKYGLIIGATTADWGDVQPEHSWGVYIDDSTHFAIDIYDNAMFVIALNNLIEIIPSTEKKWMPIKNAIEKNCMNYLWDETNQKFIPHIYLDGSPFPDDFNENEIYYFGGTAIAIEAGLLSKKEIEASLKQMVELVELAGAPSIGLTLYPPYPDGYFANNIMNPEYSYQNGGDWTWFGGRMIQELIKNGFVDEAYQQIQPMVKRVQNNDGFFEWYSVNNEPRGSSTFRGSAGVLYKAILMFEEYVEE